LDKIKVDLLVKNGSILTMDKDNAVIKDGSVAIKGSVIEAIGPAKEIDSRYTAAETLDASGHIVMPGMVDTHFHTAQQFERGMLVYLSREKKLKEPGWLYYLISFEGSLSDEDLYLSALFGYSNLLKVGTTCFADPGGPRPEIMAPALEKTGIRGILARSTLDYKQDVPIEMQDTPAGIVAKGESFYKEWNGKADGRVRTWMGMRQIMVNSREALAAIKGLADQLHTGIHIHLAEDTGEVSYAINISGLRAAEYLASLNFLDSNVLAAHSVFLSDKELDIYKKYDVSVTHCPAAAFSYCGVAKIPEMLKRGIRVGLGTDGAMSSGGSLDMFNQIKISYHGHVIVYGMPFRDPAPIMIEDILRMATIGGASAIMWDNEIGSLEKGKKADMILLSQNDLDVLPVYDALDTAACNASAAQVKTVLVNGKVVVKDGKLTNVDEEEIKARVRERAPKIVSRFLERIK